MAMRSDGSESEPAAVDGDTVRDADTVDNDGVRRFDGWDVDHVRRAGAADVDHVRAVRLAALADAPDDFDATLAEQRPWSTARWRRWITERATFILERRGEGRGLAVGEPHRGAARSAFLGAMWVHPALRGTGAADGLATAVVGWARAEGFGALCLHVESSNERARRFYERHGFRATGRRVPRARDNRTEDEMTLDLHRPADAPRRE